MDILNKLCYGLSIPPSSSLIVTANIPERVGVASSKQESKTVLGQVLLVQEQRFRLITAGGQSLLLTLDNHASTTMGQLASYAAQQRHVLVRYSGEPNLASGVAHSVQPIDSLPLKE